MNRRNGDTEIRNQEAAVSDEEAERIDIEIHANYELFIIGLLIVQVVNSLFLVLPLPNQERQIILLFWIGISLFLLLDALNRMRRASKRRRHFISYYGWMTFIGSMPVPFFTSIRLIGMVIVLRKLRRGEFAEIGRVIVAKHAQSTLLVAIFAAVLFFELGSFLVLAAEENAPTANITSAGDALWWSIVTISTVGYGDTYPTTIWGRIIGVALIIAGVGLFTTITSFLARWFIHPRPESREPLDGSLPSDTPHNQILEIRTLLTEMEANHRAAVGELETRLEQLENSVSVTRE